LELQAAADLTKQVKLLGAEVMDLMDRVVVVVRPLTMVLQVVEAAMVVMEFALL
jgi:hypothetical protein